MAVNAGALFRSILFGRGRRIVGWGLRGIVLLAIAFGCYNAIAGGLAQKWDAAQPRNQYSGVLDGAEEIDLGPRDAEVAVLLVHGFVGATNNFWELPGRLAKQGFRVRAIRLPGHGAYSHTFADTPPGDLLIEVLDEVRRLKREHERIFIVGHSLGSALGLLASTVEEVDGVVLGATYFEVTQQWYYVLPPQTWTLLTGWAIHWVYKDDTFLRVKRKEAKDKIVSYAWIPASGLRMARDYARNASDPDVLEAVSCPVLMLHSRDDFAASPEAAQRAFEGLGTEDKTFVWLKNSDHHIYWDYDREQVSDVIIGFIQERADRPR